MKKRLSYAILDGLGFGAVLIVIMIYLFKQPADNSTLIKGVLSAIVMTIMLTTVVKVQR